MNSTQYFMKPYVLISPTFIITHETGTVKTHTSTWNYVIYHKIGKIKSCGLGGRMIWFEHLGVCKIPFLMIGYHSLDAEFRELQFIEADGQTDGQM